MNHNGSGKVLHPLILPWFKLKRLLAAFADLTMNRRTHRQRLRARKA